MTQSRRYFPAFTKVYIYKKMFKSLISYQVRIFFVTFDLIAIKQLNQN